MYNIHKFCFIKNNLFHKYSWPLIKLNNLILTYSKHNVSIQLNIYKISSAEKTRTVKENS